METKHFENVTLYRAGEFLGAYGRFVCKSVKVSVRPYAQYPSALLIEFLPKGCRKWRQFIDYNRPTTVIVRGHDTPAPPAMYRPALPGSADAAVQQSSHLAHSDGWYKDFKAAILDNDSVDVLANFHGFDTNQRREALTA